jgi:hypothetical protein
MSKTMMRMLSLRASVVGCERRSEEGELGERGGRESAGEAATRPSVPPSHSPRPWSSSRLQLRYAILLYFSPRLQATAGRQAGPGWEQFN